MLPLTFRDLPLMCAGQLRVVVTFSQLRVVVTSCSQLRVVVYGLAAFWIFTISSAIAFAFLAFNIDKSILIFIDINIMFYIKLYPAGPSLPMPMLAAAVGQSTRQLLPQRFRAASAQLPRILGGPPPRPCFKKRSIASSFRQPCADLPPLCAGQI